MHLHQQFDTYSWIDHELLREAAARDRLAAQLPAGAGRPIHLEIAARIRALAARWQHARPWATHARHELTSRAAGSLTCHTEQ
jgi:hypothetical protein